MCVCGRRDVQEKKLSTGGSQSIVKSKSPNEKDTRSYPICSIVWAAKGNQNIPQKTTLDCMVLHILQV